jgi:hypothetical protein
MTRKQIQHTLHRRLRNALQELIVVHYEVGGSGSSTWPCSKLIEAFRAINVNLDARKLFSSIQKELLEDGWLLGDPTPDWSGTMKCSSIDGLGERIVHRACVLADNDDEDSVLVLKRNADGDIVMYEGRGVKKRSRVDATEEKME